MTRRLILLAAGVGLLAAPALGAGLVSLRNDPVKAKLAAGAEDAVVVVLLDDPSHPGTRILFQRYDVAARKLIPPPHGDKHPYGFAVSFAKLDKVAQDVGAYVGVVPAGDYVLLGDVTPEPKVDSFCFAAPVMHVEAGSVSFVGGYRPASEGSSNNPDQKSSLAWRGDLEAAREALTRFPALKARLVPAAIKNGATFDCSGDNMWEYRVPGAADLPVGQ